jgi:hypothetical protein
MELLSKEQIRQLIQDGKLKDIHDVQSMLKDLFASTVQEMLEAELDTHLGYSKYDAKHKVTDNARNGHGTKRTVQSELGEIDIARERQTADTLNYRIPWPAYYEEGPAAYTGPICVSILFCCAHEQAGFQTTVAVPPSLVCRSCRCSEAAQTGTPDRQMV